MDARIVLLCDAVSWRLDVFREALQRFRTAMHGLGLRRPLTVGYRSGSDLAVLTVRAPAAVPDTAERLMEAVALPGLRLVDLTTLGIPVETATARLLDGCELVARLEPDEVVAVLRARLGILSDARASMRMRIVLPLRLRLGARTVDAMTTDIAASGAFVRTAEKPPLGARLPVTFFPDSQGDPPSGELEVMRPAADGFGARLHLGPAAQAALFARVRSMLSHRRAPVHGPSQPSRRILLAHGGARRAELAATLRAGGCEVNEAADCAEALSSLLETVLGLDLLVVAADLPPDGAGALVHRVRGVGGESELPIAVLVAEAPGAGAPPIHGEGVTLVTTAHRSVAETAAELECFVAARCGQA